jgi:hypothetical protein
MHAVSEPSRAATREVPDLSSDAAARAVTAIGLMTVGIIHALQIPDQLSGAVWLTAGFCLIAVTAPGCGLWLLARPGPLPWLAGGALCLSVAAGYVVTRSIPLPGDPHDAGNWLEPLAVAALITEGMVVVLASLVLAARLPARAPASQQGASR